MGNEILRRSGIVPKSIDVLLVEDDEDSRAMMVLLFEANDCLVRAAATAHAAHELAIARVPDVVVADLHLRGGSAGWTLAEALRQHPRTQDVALIAVTGEIEPRWQVVSPFDAYLRKPVDTELLLGLVRQLSAVSRSQRRARRTG